MRSIRTRLTVLSTAVLVAVLALASAGVIWFVEGELRDDLEDQNLQTIDTIADQIETGTDPFLIDLPLATDGTEFAISTAEGEFLNVSLAQAAFFDNEFELGFDLGEPEFVAGEILIGPDGTEFVVPEDFDDTEVITLDSEVLNEFLTDASFTTIERSVIAPNGEELVVSAFSPTLLVERSVGGVRSALLLIIPLLAAAFAAIAWFTTGRVLRPVDEMTARADRISTDTLDQRLDRPGTNDEIDRLATTLNGMLERLDRGAQAQKQFVSDASHELQSPLTVMIGEAELASRDDSKLSGANELVIEHGRRMAVLIQDLLDLSRSAEVIPNRSDVDLDEIVREEARLSPAAVDTKAIAPARIRGDERSLSRVVRNLIDNAARYGGETIAVSSGFSDHRQTAIVTVDDDGEGIPMAEREKVFDRFTRLDQSRNRTTGGTGLGLAIAKSIIDAHGGTIEIEDSPLGGARFRIELPA